MRDKPKAVLLVGGFGTRLRPVVSSAPKAVAPVGSRPFLELLLRQLYAQGFHRFVMCTGYLAQQVEDEISRIPDSHNFQIEFSRESVPMGTAGAIKLAKQYLEDEPDFLVLNGDSILEVDFARLLRFHRTHGAFASLATVSVEDAARYGTVQTSTDDRVLGFSEKTGKSSPGVINGGVYVFEHSVLDVIPEKTSSLERELFPSVLHRGVYASKQEGIFIDIGTPEDYFRAQGIYERLLEVASRRSEAVLEGESDFS